MKLVTRNDIERWAERIDSKGDLPYLIARLVRATTPSSTQSDFPSGSSAYIGGWDGVVTCLEDTSYVPSGISLYELGTEEDNKGKADDDYDKRKKDSLGYTPSECVFTFITPRFWKMKDKWIAAKKKENFWKDVRVYDASNLEQWLDNALATSRWFSSKIGKYPFDGIMTADEFWDEWSTGPRSLKLLPEVVTVGRENEQKQLLSILQGEPSIKGIKASTKNEAIAFIIATAKQFPQNESERFFSKSLLVDTEANFRGTIINAATPLNLIPRFDETQPLYLAVSKGHHILMPLGADDTFNQETITLPTIDRDGQIGSLVKCGIDKVDAEKFSKESGRNITILKKLIGFPNTKTKWLDTENIREIIPALILGRWDERYVGDIELVEKLSGLPYSEYLVILNKWKNFEESPLIQIGESWRLTSPLDLWTNLSPHLTKIDLHQIKDCFNTVYKNGNPYVEPNDKKDFNSIFNKKVKFSAWAREGLAQSLILIGRFGKSLNIPNLTNPQQWVDSIIHDLLFNANGELWISVDYELPLISEASPESFLKAINHSLAKEQPEIMDMFKEVQAFIHTTSHHTGLLWALEGLAWMPEYLRDVGLILLKLSKLDPGGSLSNRPSNSISEIFKPWHYQTLASYDERMEILKFITEKERESGWDLLIRMLPDHHGVAHPTHKMRWRIFDKNTNLSYYYKDIYNTHTFVISCLISLFDNSEIKFASLIDEIAKLSPKDKAIVIDWAEKNYANIKQTTYIAWETVRKILYHHRSHPDTDWSLHESELKRLDGLYEKLEPTDTLNKYIWLFNDNWVQFPEGYNYEDEKNDIRDKHQQKVDSARVEAVKLYLKEFGLKKTLDLRKSIKYPGTLGDALARVITKDKEIELVCDTLNDEQQFLNFIYSFIFRKSVIEEFDWIINLIRKLQKKNFSDSSIANLLIPLNVSRQLWDFISTLKEGIKNEYWLKVNPNIYHIPKEDRIFAIQMLMQYKRYISAVDESSHFAEELPTEVLIELLQKLASEESNEPVKIKEYEIFRIFEAIDKRSDIDSTILVKLEWQYLPILSSYGTRRNPKKLEDELSKSPRFFVDLLKWVFIPKDKKKLKKEREGVSDEEIQNRATQAFHLLNSWKKIPGMKPDNSIDFEELRLWVNEVRKLAKKESRLEVADMQIGKVLAQYPENTPDWPQENIFKIIEEINTDSLKRNYSSEMFNKRSFSSRGTFDGGAIERGHADYFDKLSNDYKIKYPNVSEIFKRLSKGYLEDAKRMDNEAERSKLEY